MNANEWALIIFTVLAQMSVGSFIVLGFIHYFTRRTEGTEAADQMSDRALLAIGPVLILAMLASLFHLGNPLYAPRAITNVANSWLSREILFGVLFAVTGGVFAIMQWRKISSFALRNVIALVAAVIGLGLVTSMAMVYMLRSQPAWNSLATPVSFFVTTFLLGLFAVAAAFVANYGYLKNKDAECAEANCVLVRRALRWIVATSLVLLGVTVLVIPLYVASLGSGTGAAVESIRILTEDHLLLFGLRIALVFLGAGVLGFFLYQNATAPGQEKMMRVLAYSAFALVFVAEVVGRFLFYASHVRIGV